MKSFLWLLITSFSAGTYVCAGALAPPESHHAFLNTKPGNSRATTPPHKKTQTPPPPPPKQVDPEWPSRAEIGANYTYMTVKPDGQSTFKGSLGGLQGFYEYRPADAIYAGIRLDWKQGSTSQSSNKRSITYVDTHERLGYTFTFLDEDVWLTPFTGFGYRYIGQNLQYSSEPSLKFGYNEFYVPVGFDVNHRVNCWFTWGLEFIWMPQVFTTVNIKPLDGAYWTLTRRLDNFYVALPLDFSFGKDRRFHVVINPFYERWHDGHSTAETLTGVSLDLPSNTYNLGGVMLNFGYDF